MAVGGWAVEGSGSWCHWPEGLCLTWWLQAEAKNFGILPPASWCSRSHAQQATGFARLSKGSVTSASTLPAPAGLTVAAEQTFFPEL